MKVPPNILAQPSIMLRQIIRFFVITVYHQLGLSSAVKRRDRRAKKGKDKDRPGYLVDDTLSGGALQTLFYSGLDNNVRWSIADNIL